MDFESKLLEIVRLINQEAYKSADSLIDECLYSFPNDCELNYLYGVSKERQGLPELAYYLYKLAMILAQNDEDRDIVLSALNELSKTAEVNQYRLGKAVEEIALSRIMKKEYIMTERFLSEIIYDNNRVAADIVLTEQNMLLKMLLEIVLCEKNFNPDTIYDTNSSIIFNNDISAFKMAYNELKFCIRRIWFGCGNSEQKEIADVIRKYNISSDMLAVVVKYSVVQDFWINTFEKIAGILSRCESTEFLEYVNKLNIYKNWIEKGGLTPQKKVYEPDDFDNGFEYIKLDYRDRYSTDIDNGSKIIYGTENTFSIIFCTNDETYERECLIYLKKLIIPKGMRLVVVSVWNATGMAAGYNYAMERVKAKYRLFIHHDTFVIKNDCLIKLSCEFDKDRELGMLGIFGSMDLVDSALWYKSEWITTRLNLYQDAILTIKVSTSEFSKDYVEPACMIDGVFIATSKDIPWREDLFDGWHFYDISSGFEMRKAGYKTGFLMDSTGIWVMHETTMRKDSHDLYNKYRKVFIDNYL